jgi:hypothetical protein
MFISFGVQYAGYIDMAHVGYDGTPVNDMKHTSLLSQMRRVSTPWPGSWQRSKR